MARDDDLAGMDPDTRDDVQRDRDRWAARIADAKKRFAVDNLIGMTVEDARVAVEAAGGEFVTDDGPISLKLDCNRLVASVDAGRVTDTHIG